jgi:enoyl-CoA hydratase/carnithine racemase
MVTPEFRMLDRPLIVTKEGPVASIQLAQPKTLNAITLRSASALLEALRDLAADNTLRAVADSYHKAHTPPDHATVLGPRSGRSA